MKLKVTKPFGINFSIDFSCRGVLWILSDKDDQRFWGGFQIFDSGFFWVGKFGKYIFGWLDLSQDFWGCFSCYIS